MKNFHVFSFAIFSAAITLHSPAGLAQSAGGTVLFAQPGVQILDANGTARPALRGDVLRMGERVLTPPGAISQLQLPDGSLIGLRPGSELKVELPPAASDRAEKVLSLLHGSVRVVGAELMDRQKSSQVTIQAGQATLRLSGADIESAVLRPAVGAAVAGRDASPPGSYSRLTTGAATLVSGTAVEALQARQVSFVSPASPTPTILATAAPAIFASGSLRTTGLPALATEPTNRTAAPLPALDVLAGPSRTTSTLTALRTNVALPGSTPAIAPPLVFSPISTNVTLGPTAVAAAGPAAGPTLSPTTIGPVLMQPRFISPPPVIIRPPVVCRITSTGLRICS